MATKIEKCPRCGASAKVLQGLGPGNLFHQVRCPKCRKARPGSLSMNRDRAVAMWNEIAPREHYYVAAVKWIGSARKLAEQGHSLLWCDEPLGHIGFWDENDDTFHHLPVDQAKKGMEAGLFPSLRTPLERQTFFQKGAF